MSKRFRTRVYVVHLPGGARLGVGDPPDFPDGTEGRVFDYIGPAPVTPREFATAAELDAWEWGMCRAGYAESGEAAMSRGGPAVEELPPPAAAEGASLTIALSVSGGHSEGDGRVLVVGLTNTGTEAVPRTDVYWEYQEEAPSPVGPDGETALRSGCYRLTPERWWDGTLKPGETRQFILGAGHLAKARGHVASLSPGRYWLGVRSGDVEFRRDANPMLADIIEASGA